MLWWGDYIVHIRHQRPNSWTKSRNKSPEFSSLLFTVTSKALPWDFFLLKLTQPLTVSTVQLLYTVKEKGGKSDRNYIPYLWFKNPLRNIKSEDSQEYAQKLQRNWTLMISASVLIKQLNIQVKFFYIRPQFHIFLGTPGKEGVEGASNSPRLKKTTKVFFWLCVSWSSGSENDKRLLLGVIRTVAQSSLPSLL